MRAKPRKYDHRRGASAHARWPTPHTSPNVTRLRAYDALLQIRLAGLDQGLPVVRRIPAPEHFRENGIRVGSASRRPQGLFIVDPGINDDLRLRVVAEEQPIPPSELGPPPVAPGRPHGVALPILVACRITW